VTTGVKQNKQKKKQKEKQFEWNKKVYVAGLCSLVYIFKKN